MAIKGKGRTRTRQAVRAPRREPVPVPRPFAQRRAVQVVAAFLAGLLLFWGGIWLTNGLREESRSKASQQQELARRRAGSAWQREIETQVGKIGTIQQAAPPVLLPKVRSTITTLAKEDPKGAAAALESAAADAQTAADAIGKYDLTGSLQDRGFDAADVLQFLSARDELVTAISLYREAALTGAVAAGLDGDARTKALDTATSLLTLADTALTRFEQHQLEALASAGIRPGLPGA
jgi:hypothetical protein